MSLCAQDLLVAEEYRRSLEVKLREAQRRSEWMRETEAQIQSNERARKDYLTEVGLRLLSLLFVCPAHPHSIGLCVNAIARLQEHIHYRQAGPNTRH